MPQPLSDALGVTAAALSAAGVFNGFVDLDSRLHIDPHLLAHSTTPEMKGARERFDEHFVNVFKLVRASKGRGDIFWKKAVENLIFAEIPNTGLGYARQGKAGSAIGGGLAVDLADLAMSIVAAGYEDPTIFDLVGLLQDGIGADRISDMTAHIIRGNILAFSQRVAATLGLPSIEVAYGAAKYSVPKDPSSGLALYLLPSDILRTLPVADSWSDIDLVAGHNDHLRKAVNGIIGDTWKVATTKTSKAALRATLLKNPELIGDLLTQYKTKPATPYDFGGDPEALFRWFAEATGLAVAEPLNLDPKSLGTRDEAIKLVREICGRFKEMVEANRLSRLLYDDAKKPRPEKTAQLVFWAIADTYCRANNLDLSPEVDSGAGPVDFKFSKGYDLRINVEVKLSSNGQLVHGLEKQLPAYDAAEKSVHSIYLLIRTTETAASIDRAIALRRQLEQEKKRVPDIVIVDGRLKPSASKL